ncbi:MAG: hypothetical protein ACE1Y4_04705 [Lysobacterales bacterium]
MSKAGCRNRCTNNVLEDFSLLIIDHAISQCDLDDLIQLIHIEPAVITEAFDGAEYHFR